MQFNLISHPSTPPAEPGFKVWANVDHASLLGTVASTNIWFGVGAPAERFVIPEAAEPGRANELWRTTCFEAFVGEDGAQAYREWNFAPSGEWAAYDFSAYRADGTDAEVATPYVRMEDNFTWWSLGATIAVDGERPWRLGLSVVLEEQGGAKSYWALAHPPGDKPDFHHPDCFVAQLP